MTSARIPEATSLGDGRWWIEDHVDPAAAVLAVVVAEMVYNGPARAGAFLLGEAPRTSSERFDHADDLVARVRHVWKKPDPTDEERLLSCSEDDPAGRPWTEVLR